MHTQTIHTQKNLLRCIAILLILGLSVPLIGISPQDADACPAADQVCAGLFAGVVAFCQKKDTKWWECVAAGAGATALCLAAHALCPSS